MADGVMKTLCEHAHSANPELRIDSLWALKHLVSSAPNDIKINCLEELGTGWLIQIVTGESSFASTSRQGQSGSPMGMGTPNAAGEQVDLLNAVEEPGMDVDYALSEDEADTEDDDQMTDSIGSLRLPRYTRKTPTSQLAARLKAIKHVEQSPVLKAQREDIRVQEQALDFIRNLIGEAGPGQPEMIDHLL